MPVHGLRDAFEHEVGPEFQRSTDCWSRQSVVDEQLGAGSMAGGRQVVDVGDSQ
jgi:hypothetical protein